MTVQYIQAHDQWDAQTGFLHGNLLQPVGGGGIPNADERSDLALANIVLVAVNHRVVNDRLVGRLRNALILEHLQCLLLADFKTADR